MDMCMAYSLRPCRKLMLSWRACSDAFRSFLFLRRCLQLQLRLQLWLQLRLRLRLRASRPSLLRRWLKQAQCLLLRPTRMAVRLQAGQRQRKQQSHRHVQWEEGEVEHHHRRRHHRRRRRLRVPRHVQKVAVEEIYSVRSLEA